MSQPTNLPSFWSRLSLAFGAFFKTLGDADFAARVRDDQVGPVAAPAPEALAVVSFDPSSLPATLFFNLFIIPPNWACA